MFMLVINKFINYFIKKFPVRGKSCLQTSPREYKLIEYYGACKRKQLFGSRV